MQARLRRPHICGRDHAPVDLAAHEAAEVVIINPDRGWLHERGSSAALLTTAPR
jgi:hypothetical protein